MKSVVSPFSCNHIFIQLFPAADKSLILYMSGSGEASQIPTLDVDFFT